MNNFIDQLMEYFEKVYKDESQKIVDNHIKQITIDLNDLRSRIITQASLSVRQQVNISDFGSTIRIEIMKEKNA